MSTEVVKAETFGIEEAKANELVSGLDTILAEREALKKSYLDVIELEITKENIPVFRELRIKIKDNRTKGIEKWHKNTKAFFLAGGRFVDAKKNMESAINEDWEAKLLSAEKHYEIIEAERKEALKIERMRQLEAFEIFTNDANVENMSEDVWKNYSNGVRLNYEAVKEAEAKAEAERIEANRKSKLMYDREREILPLSDHINIKLLTIDTTEDEFKTMIEKAKEIKLQAAELQKEREREAEKIRLKAEADAKAAREAKAKADAELVKVQAEAKAKQEALEEQARKDREAADKLRKESEAKKAAEDAKLKAEQEAVKLAAQAPDKDKIKATVKALEMPKLELSTKECKYVYNEITAEFEAFKKWAETQVNTLK